MVGRDAPQNPEAISAAPAAASDRWTRTSVRWSRAAAMSTPTAPPANTKPAHGNSVKFVRSPAGLRYHCAPIGSAFTHPAIRTSGVDIAKAMASDAYARLAATALLESPQTRPAAA